MRVVWMVRSRQIIRKLAWWLSLIGYDRNDHTLGHRIYLVYASIFWSIWFLALSSLLAGPTGTLLQTLGVTPLSHGAAALMTLVLTGWGLLQLWQAARSSPFVFSEDDAHLICQTPVPGSAVALTWFLGDWFEQAALFGVGAFILSIAIVDFRLGQTIKISDVPAYILEALGALVVVLLVQMGLTALIWAVGALRLHGNRQPGFGFHMVRLGVVAVGLGLASVLVYLGMGGFNHPVFQVALWPIHFPLLAALGSTPLAYGMIGGLAWAGIGLVALARAGSHLNLSRAAQETSQKEKVISAQRYGQGELAQQLALSNRLRGGRSPSQLPALPGWRILLWKDALQSVRAVRMSDVWGWLALLTVSLGICLAPDWGTRGLALAIWTVMVGQRVTARLHKDLTQWGLLRLLPFSSKHLLVAELALPWALVVLMGLSVLALASGAWLVPVRLLAALLLLSVSASISVASAYDILHQADSDMLLKGISPQSSSKGTFLGMLCLVLPLGLWVGLNHLNVNGTLLSVALASVLVLMFWRLASRQLIYMK